MRYKHLAGILAVTGLLLNGCSTGTGGGGGGGEPPPDECAGAGQACDTAGDCCSGLVCNEDGICEEDSTKDEVDCEDCPDLSEAVDVVGAVWVDGPVGATTSKLCHAKPIGPPTVGPPTSHSSESFGLEITGLADGRTTDDVETLLIGIDGLAGHYALDVGPEDRTPDGHILATVVQVQADVLDDAFTLQVAADDGEPPDGSDVGFTEVSAAFFSASAGEDGMAEVGETVALEAIFTGGSGTPQVTWGQVAGTDVSIADPTAASTMFVPAEVGTYVMRLEAIDPTGAIDVDLVSILVVEEFTVDAGESRVVEVGDTVELRGLAAGGTGQADFEWTEVSTHGILIEDPDSRIASFMPTEPGEYKFQLTATDEILDEATDFVMHLAVDGLTAMATAPGAAALGETIQLQGQAGGGLYPYAFRWSQTGGPDVEIEDATNQTALVTLDIAGDYTFELLVEDSTGSSAVDNVTTSVPCTENPQCDDGAFCNGPETCVDGGCQAGASPCTAEEVCYEEDEECRPPCTTDADCDDGEYCNGAETCDTNGECQPGTFPCDDNEICLENEDECVPITDDVFVFADNFEEGLGDWSVDNAIWEVGVPTSGPNKAYSPVHLAATVLAGDHPENHSRLVSPSISLPTINTEDEIHLRFWHWFSFDANDRGQVQVQEQITPGEWTGWTDLDFATFTGEPGDSDEFTRPSIDISGYAGKKVRIGFYLGGHGCCGTRAGWYIDDVVIEVR